MERTTKLRLIDIITPPKGEHPYVLRFVRHYQDTYDTYFRIYIDDMDYGKLYLPHSVFEKIAEALKKSDIPFSLQEERVMTADFMSVRGVQNSDSPKGRKKLEE